MKVEEAKGGDRAGTKDKWGMMEVGKCILTEEYGLRVRVRPRLIQYVAIKG